MLTGPELVPEFGGIAKSLVILLHGYGADGNDLIGLAPYFAESLPDTFFISPDAPEPCAMNPFGGRQWFDLSSFEQSHMIKGAMKSAPLLEEFINAQLERFSLSPEKLVLVGFSQGTMMALYVAARLKFKIGGVLGYSGLFLEDEQHPPIAKPDVCLIHGEVDPVVPFICMENAKKALLKHGSAVEVHPRPFLAHGIDEEGMELGRSFLEGKLADFA